MDAFPSNPIGEKRILRIFRNINPSGQPRRWRVGEDFSAMAGKFLPRLPGYSPLSARLLAALKITKARRSEYDHLMLHLHDALKQDQDLPGHRAAGGRALRPRPDLGDLLGSGHAWGHGGQYMLEQTAYLAVADQAHPERSPQRLLAKALGRPLR